MPAALVWFRTDLRLADHEALLAACARGAVVPVFLWAPEEEGAWPPGAAARVWLHHSLKALAERLHAQGSRLVIRRGPTAASLVQLCRETGADAVYWTRRYEPAIAARDERVAQALGAQGLHAEPRGGGLLFEPQELATTAGRPYQVFTPFARTAMQRLATPRPRAAPSTIPTPAIWPEGLSVDALGLLPEKDWARGFFPLWKPGEAGAQAALKRFADRRVESYASARDFPAADGSARLSPHLHWGEISPAQAWNAAGRAASGAAAAFQRQLLWREFAAHLLHHFPDTDREPLRPDFAGFRWRQDAAALRAWHRGQTGYPMVDAGMRELWSTGFMHNRVRMIVGSFLVKHLLLPWQEGARWFWDTLVDADLANNSLGWQWVAGCGADAAPYFRVFNPTLQARRYDPREAYQKRWIPELHTPEYARPIVEHREARARALAVYANRRTLP